MTLTDLPTEILFEVLKDLNKNDLYQCLYVSHTLNPIAYYQLMSDITLSGPDRIQNFAADIDSLGAYLKAIKTITIDNSAYLEAYRFNYFLTQQEIQGIFFRLPNLTNIKVKGDLTILRAFRNEQFCQALFERFPAINVEVCSERYYWAPEIYELRFLWTVINIDKMEGFSWQLSPSKFLINIPHLKTIRGYYGEEEDFWEDELAPALRTFDNLTLQ